MKLFVFSENIALTAELISSAAKVGEAAEVSAIVLGAYAEAEKVAGLGVKKVYWLGEEGERIADDFIPTIGTLIEKETPDLFLVGATVLGKAVAARVAAKLNTSAIVNAKEIGTDGAVSHVIYGGGAVRIEKAKEGTEVVTIAAGSAEAAKATGSMAEICNVAFVEPTAKIVRLNKTAKKAGNSDILAAKRVVAVGRGFYNDEDLQYAKDLASELDAAMGYTRPVIELDLPSLEGEPYIGVSGIQIKPDLYIGVAVSGQTQHMVGVNDSRIIVGINKDDNAMIFNQCDYGIVGDYKEIIPALIEVLRAEKNK